MKKDQNLKWKQNKDMWESFNAFAMSDIETGKEGKVHRMIEWRRELTEWWRRSMKRWKKEGVMESHLQEQQM